MVARRASRGRYEITVHGVVGPVVLSALPAVTAVRRPARTVLLIRLREGCGIADVVRRLTRAGIGIIGIRLLRDRDQDCRGARHAVFIPPG